MALDVGEKRIGVAFSDPLGVIAQGRTVISRTSDQATLAQLADLIRREKVQEVVVGLPLNMNGSRGPKAREVEEFAAQLERACAVPVTFWDERLSTVEAERRLLEADVSRARRRRVADQMAAALILEGYLARQRAGQANLPREGQRKEMGADENEWDRGRGRAGG